MNHVRREFARINHPKEPACHPASARRVVVDGTNHVQALDAAEEGKSVTAIQVCELAHGVAVRGVVVASVLPI